MTSASITADHVERYDRDGVVKVAGAVAPDVVAAIGGLAERQLRDPGPWVTDTNPGSRTDRLFTSRYLWRDQPEAAALAFDSGVAGLAAALMSSSQVRLYFDHLLVKEPETAAPTPWHQDLPYWPFRGTQICSVWVAATPATTADSSLEFVRGSHRWGVTFAPEPFDGEADWTADHPAEPCPDIEADRARYDIVGFDVEPGDALVFSAAILHGSPANTGAGRRVALSTRWLGDDAVWWPEPGCDPTITQDDTTARRGGPPHDDDRFPVAWPTRTPG